MDSNFKNTYSNIYFLGIGGVSMSGLAEILLSKGIHVSGSDMKDSATIKRLKNLGIKINLGHNSENITKDIDLLVYTAAVKSENPELIKAKELNIKIIDRAELLGKIMKNYSNSIAVSGTHGKTTTTSMISEILLSAKTDPTISIGGTLSTIKGNIRVGKSEYFVAEACEYFDSFLKFNPLVAVILNVEADHLDYFKDLQQIQTSFKNFAGRVPESGFIIINKDIDNLNYITENIKSNVVTYSVNNDDALWTAKNIVHLQNGTNSFDALYKGEFFAHINLNVPGEHNISNSLAACAAAHALNLTSEDIAEGLLNFGGVDRRFQTKGTFNGVTVIDDYAHHPTEIAVTLAATKKVDHNKTWCVFQPHTYSRTKIFLNEFSEAFENADNIIIADIFAAREKDTGEISSKDLVEKIVQKGKNAQYLGDLSQIEAYLKKNCSSGDLLITMGAGDVYIVGENLIRK